MTFIHNRLLSYFLTILRFPRVF